jgi:uncharacterized membrane protein YdjX (TVP38/TMEM64 family)
VTDAESTDSRYFASAAARRRAIRHTVALAAVVLALTAGLYRVLPQATDPVWLRATVADFGPLAPLAFVGLQTIQVIVAPLPGQMLAGVGGYLFGALPGTVYSMTGVLLGSTVVFLLARRYGRPYVERVLDAGTVARWDGVVDRAGVPGLFLFFLLPTFPDDLLCAVAGCTDIRLRTFLALVAVGRTPSFLAAAYAGGQLSAGDVGRTVAVLALLAVVTVAVYVGRHRLLATLESVR